MNSLEYPLFELLVFTKDGKQYNEQLNITTLEAILKHYLDNYDNIASIELLSKNEYLHTQDVIEIAYNNPF